MPRVLNRKTIGNKWIPNSVYVGRPSAWGNPFTIGRDGSRAEVIAKYRAWICDQPELISRLSELRGKDLICWCSPLPCHADVLLDLADGVDKLHMVTRTDDAGNTVLVQDGLGPCQALAVHDKLEACGHKQSYSIMRYATPSDRDNLLRSLGIIE